MNWIDHVKKFQKENNLSYKDALSKAKTSYVKKSVPKTPSGVKEAKDYIKKNNLNYSSALKDSRKYQMEN